jgi:hypothetical protein
LCNFAWRHAARLQAGECVGLLVSVFFLMPSSLLAGCDWGTTADVAMNRRNCVVSHGQLASAVQPTVNLCYTWHTQCALPLLHPSLMAAESWPSAAPAVCGGTHVRPSHASSGGGRPRGAAAGGSGAWGAAPHLSASPTASPRAQVGHAPGGQQMQHVLRSGASLGVHP